MVVRKRDEGTAWKPSKPSERRERQQRGGGMMNSHPTEVATASGTETADAPYERRSRKERRNEKSVACDGNKNGNVLSAAKVSTYRMRSARVRERGRHEWRKGKRRGERRENVRTKVKQIKELSKERAREMGA